jgi:hypothetical protein
MKMFSRLFVFFLSCILVSMYVPAHASVDGDTYQDRQHNQQVGK